MVIGFCPRIAVVAFDRPQPLAVGDPVRLRLGIDDGECTVLARVLHRLDDHARPAIAFTLPDRTAAARRGDGRVPYDVRVSLLVADGRVIGDPHQRARAADLSVSGLAIVTDRELPTGAAVLVRLPLDGRRHDSQLRAQVRWCRPDETAPSAGERRPAPHWRCGLVWQTPPPDQVELLARTVARIARDDGSAAQPAA